MNDTVRILLVDDHNLVRAGMRALLDQMPGVEVVGEAVNGEEALKLAQRQRPDLVLMDIAMKGMNGLVATAAIRKALPDSRVLILSMHASEDYVQQALAAGAGGYMLKDAATVELELAMRAALQGEIYLSPAISRHVVDSYLHGGPRANNPSQVLTPRQLEILCLIASGKATKEIAFDLGLSVKTVETHRAQIMDRLAIHDVPGLVRYAVRTGLITADE